MDKISEFDAVVVGAGFAGLYMLHRLREIGLSTRVYEAGEDVGGAWYWNRYPGAQCDSESIYYCYTFSDELYQEWNWTSRYARQSEILHYLNYVADKFDLRRDIQFERRVKSCHYDETKCRWKVYTDDGTWVIAKYIITAVGCLSSPNIPDFKGINNFEGECYHTANWPHEKVNFRGKSVGVIGNGSSGVQAIPVIAQEAEHLFAFQRTPQYCIPARNYNYNQEFIRQVKENFNEIKQKMRKSRTGFPMKLRKRSALEDTPEERHRVYEEGWEKGGLGFLFESYQDLLVDENANKTVSDFIRSKIREIVNDTETANQLIPTYFFGTKRPILDTDYYETFNYENVSLVDIRHSPIMGITSKGILTTDGEYKVDMIIIATGFDAMTGSLFKMDIRGKDGVALRAKWANGAQTKTYLGIATAGFPNLFMITGPESPSVMTNMSAAIEQHVEWISDCIKYLRETGVESIEAICEAEKDWSNHCKQVANATLFPLTDSWYTGSNVAGKPRGFPIYLGGLGKYRQICDDVASDGYRGFSLYPNERVG